MVGIQPFEKDHWILLSYLFDFIAKMNMSHQPSITAASKLYTKSFNYKAKWRYLRGNIKLLFSLLAWPGSLRKSTPADGEKKTWLNTKISISYR